MGVDRTLNPVIKSKSRKRCFGCNLKAINQWCSYRWWPEERRAGFSFRVARKIHLLPTCKRENFEYKEKEEFVNSYCQTLGMDPKEILGAGCSKKGGKSGGRKKKEYVIL